MHTEFAPGEVEKWMRLGFEIEAKSWKGVAGTAVLQQPGMAESYIRNARQLAEWGHLAIFFLEFAGEPIAFDYAWHAKGCHFCVKMGYDDAHRKYGPGQQMYLQILQRLHEDPNFDLADFWGQKMPWNESWATHFYPVGRLVMSPRRSARVCGFVAGYKYLRPVLRRLIGRERVVLPDAPINGESSSTDAGADLPC